MKNEGNMATTRYLRVVLMMFLAPLGMYAQFYGCGFDPSKMMYIPLTIDPTRARLDQFPVGWSGIKPVGQTEDGTPVFDRMPVYEEIDGAFIALVEFPNTANPYFPGLPRAWHFPAKGRAREKCCRQLKQEMDNAFAQQRQVQAYRNISGEALLESLEDEIARTDMWAKQQALRDKEHQRQLDLMDKRFYHMNDNQLRHYREGWKPVVQPVGGMQYGTPDLMVDPSGYLYWVP